MTYPTWQPNHTKPWPEQVNGELSRQGVGLEDHERRIESLEAELLRMELLFSMLERSLDALRKDVRPPL